MTHGALRATHQLKSRLTKGGKKGENLIFFFGLVSGGERGEERV